MSPFEIRKSERENQGEIRWVTSHISAPQDVNEDPLDIESCPVILTHATSFRLRTDFEG